MPAIRPKLLLVGLDGASHDLITLWAGEGKLPTFHKIIEQGAFGKLKTVVPPHSAMAWVSAFTGKNAGKHGIFYFTDLKEPNLRIKSSRDIKSKTVWNILSDADKQPIVVNAPFTYPPEKINGIVIAGFTTPMPYTEKEITYPKELKKDLFQMNYEIDLHVDETISLLYTNKRRLLERLFELEDKRLKMVTHLMKSYAWDALIVVFTILDRVQHMFWGYMDEKNPVYSPKDARKYGDYIFRSYQKADCLLKNLINMIEEDTYLITISDHGFGSVHKYFYVNKWLSQLKLLKTKKHIFQTVFGPLTFQENLIKKLSNRIAIKLGLKLLDFNASIQGLSLASPSNIDFSRTKVFCPVNYGYVRFNIRGRDPQGIVDRQKEYDQLREYLKRTLHSLIDPETGERFVKRVYGKEELYWGPHVEDGPDLIFETHERYFPLANLLTSVNLFQPSKERESGNHRDNGFIGLLGPEIQKGKEIEGSHIMDVAPTVLYLQGCPIPPDMDGKVLTNAFSKNFLDQHPIQHGTTSQVSKRDTSFQYTKEEEEEVKSRLRALGYI